MELTDIASAITGLDVQVGYPETGLEPPYALLRPFTLDPVETAIGGCPIGWDERYVAYCVGASVETSYNVARLVMTQLAGRRVGGVVVSVELAYGPSMVEGLYETVVTIQGNQGGING